MKINFYKLKSGFKGILFVFGVLLTFCLFSYNYYIVNQLRAESRQILLFYAQLYASAASDESSANLNFIFEEIILATNFPIVLADPEGAPSAWKGIAVASADHSKQGYQRVREISQIMGGEADPIPLMYGDFPIGYLYYGDSILIKQLQLLPYVGIAAVGVFILVGFLGFRSVQRSEQQFIWVGMSKETAHQIGTPLSSIMGWIELIKTRSSDKETQQTIHEMEKDVERLSRVTARFSQIGSKPDLKEVAVNHVIMDVLNYFRRRLPQWGKRVELLHISNANPKLLLNRDLFEWVLENLVKNALDAIVDDVGKVVVEIGEIKNGSAGFYIDVTDTGKGISAARKKDVFKPGFSTKSRGWGLGLSLAKRIIEDYHGGKLVVKESKPEKGTTMRILF